MSEKPTPADLQAIEIQLGRTPRDVHYLAHIALPTMITLRRARRWESMSQKSPIFQREVCQIE